ncbi:MAG: hypothetical protein Q9173_000399 [Seirophora scorigena]
MLPRYILPYLVADALFVATGGLLVAVILMSKSEMNVPTTDDVAPHLLLAHAPLKGALADAGLIFATFVVSLLALIFTNNRIWLKVHSWMVSWQCCGYMDIPFHSDSTCPTPIIAMSKTNCVEPFSNYANDFLDVVFTAIFGMVDAMLLLCGLVVLKKRAEEQRYRHIDKKSRYSRIWV